MIPERLNSILEPIASCTEVPSQDGMPSVRVARDELRELVRALRDAGGFETLTLVTAVDRLPAEPRFELNYQLLSLQYRSRLRLLVDLNEGDETVPTICDLYPGANYFERECFDMFGIRFEDHPYLERLLMPDGYDHHPLRKEFPQQGIEPDRLYREWERSRAQPNG